MIHGRQPALGRAELESLYGSGAIRPVGGIASAMTTAPSDINFNRLGGMVKFCKILLELETTKWEEITGFLSKSVPQQAKNLDEGRLTMGLSVYGLKTNIRSINNTGIKLKKAVKTTGRSIRIVPNKESALNSAQVLHNKLTHRLGWELVFVRDGNKTIVAQSIAVQDIEKYAARDQNRPFRDAQIGMLPPKLAQIIINLTGAKAGETICDPFCGSGVLLQEALLIGAGVIGSDINPRMVEYSKKNLDWLSQADEKICPGGIKPSTNYKVELADATKRKFAGDYIACEIYLGQPLSTLPDPEKLAKIASECDKLLKNFLENVAKQQEAGFKLSIAVPAWKTKKGFLHLETLDKLSDLGYNRLKFVHASNEELIYHRSGQIVARELVVLERK